MTRAQQTLWSLRIRQLLAEDDDGCFLLLKIHGTCSMPDCKVERFDAQVRGRGGELAELVKRWGVCCPGCGNAAMIRHIDRVARWRGEDAADVLRAFGEEVQVAL